MSAVLAKYDIDVTEKFVTRTEVAMLLANTTKPEALLLHALTVEKDKSAVASSINKQFAEMVKENIKSEMLHSAIYKEAKAVNA